LNCIRLPFNYWPHFEGDFLAGSSTQESLTDMCSQDDLDPQGFKPLDRVIDLGIYTILDLHTALGGQNTD